MYINKMLAILIAIVILSICVYQFIAKPIIDEKNKIEDPVNCVTSAWSTCINGTQTRTITPASDGGIECTDSNTTQKCTATVTQPVNCVMSSWSACVNGNKTRTITTPAVGTGTACGATSETCSATPTVTQPVNCVMSNWSDCVNGTKTRTITTPAAGTGTACGATSETCTAVTQPVNCVMSNWSDCVNGNKTRTITTPAAGTGTACGSTSETCSNCVIGAWSTCAGGSQSRTITQASNGGTVCTETNTTQNCSMPARTYNAFDNTSYNGYNLLPSENGTVEQCKTKCDNKLNCTGFVMNSGADICYFKSAITDADPTFDRNAKYYYTGTAPSKGSAKRVYNKSENTGATNAVVGELGDVGGVLVTVNECKTACDKNSECIGFTFYKDDYLCALHKQGITGFSDSGVDYYYV